ncbi:hypothetical protein ACFUYE_15000 [Micromonospora humida]|uniref:hypothetical protein n=1 Tax=Micromonospora humida TaxID=2809018 RepID=UPI00366E00B0
MITVTVDYDCPNACRYTIPTTLVGDQSALRHATLIDTLADAQHDRECPVLHTAGVGQ